MPAFWWEYATAGPMTFMHSSMSTVASSGSTAFSFAQRREAAIVAGKPELPKGPGIIGPHLLARNGPQLPKRAFLDSLTSFA